MPKKPKKLKLVHHSGYFSDPESGDHGPVSSRPADHHIEPVESYTKVNGSLNVANDTIETTHSPKKPKLSPPLNKGAPTVGRAKRIRCSDDEGEDAGLDDAMFLGGESPTRPVAPSPEKPRTEPDDCKTRKKRKKRKRVRKSPLLEFIPIMDSLLDEMLRLEGLGDAFVHATCKDCHTKIATTESTAYRCMDCDPTASWCKSCCIASHAQTYLHRVQVWTGGCFEKTTLKDLGLRVQLGHTAGKVCPHRADDPGSEFVIIDSDAIHVVMIDYCQCHQGITRLQQLLRARLLPATVLNPRTAATFRALETYQMLSFTGKVSAYEFLMAIRRRTDNTTTFSVKERNREWGRMIHLFRHLRMLKRGGRGHSETGAAGTEAGELAVLCPACPHSGINMPKDWQLLPEDQLWIHALFLAIDANFRLKRKCSSSDENDPGLNHGFAYIVAEFMFKAFLKENDSKVKEEKSNCSNHDAIKSAQVNKGKGVKAASGLGACQCARHDMKRPCGAGDLQKGERYINMDYFVLSTLRFAVLCVLVISYDIACQWSRNWRARCASYPPNPISQNPLLKPVFCVPKFHAPAHVLSCRTNFSFNLTPGVGRTDGEAPERGWSSADNLSTSTREMGPGKRRDTFDDFFSKINWDKSIWLAEDTAQKARTAIVMAITQGNAFKVFAGSIDPKYRVSFTEKVKAWEGNRNLPNPHENPEIKIDVRKTRLKLSNEDEAAIKSGLVEKVHEEVTGSVFILDGIEIEETQRRVELEHGKLGDHSTDLDRSKAQEHSNSLHRKLKTYLDMQRIFLPCATFTGFPADEANELSPDAGGNDKGSHVTDPVDPSDGDEEEDPWKIKLNLPSDLLAENRKCDRRFVRYEFLFRISQAHSTLKELRAQLLQQDHMVLSKKKYTRGTAMLTMSNSLLRDIGARIKEEKRLYRDVHRRLGLLWKCLEEAGSLEDVEDQVKWKEVLRELKSGDAKGLTCTDGRALGEGSKSVPWIWRVGADAKEMANISLRVEFCRTRARAHRWQEECLILAEEMRRIERFWAWDARRWQERAASQFAVAEARRRQQEAREKEEGIIRPPLTDFLKEDVRSIVHGKIAYAVRQGRIRTRLLEEARRQHAGLPALLEGGPPLIECTQQVPSLLRLPVVPQKPIHPGGRAHKSRKQTDQLSPQPGESDESGDELEELDEDSGAVVELQTADDEDAGKTYDTTDDES